MSRTVIEMAALAGLLTPGVAQAQPPAWVRQLGTSTNEIAYGVTSDAAGGAYVCGFTGGALGGPSAGSSDFFLARYTGTGTQVWVRQFGSSWGESLNAVAPDGAGGAFVAGSTSGSLGGPVNGQSDLLLARYDGSGAQLWVRQMGSPALDIAHALAPDGAGGVFAGGTTTGDVAGPNAGEYDLLLTRYNGAGDPLWAVQDGSDRYDSIWGAAPDQSGGVYVCGYTDGSLGAPNPGSPTSEAFVARYDDAGSRLWIRQFGNPAYLDYAFGVASDGAGGVYVGGYAEGALFGSGLGTAYIARYDGGGQLVWGRQFGGAGYSYLRAVAGAPGGVYGVGWTEGSPGGPNAGGKDVLVARYDAAGSSLGLRQIGTAATDEGRGAAPDGSGGVYVAGSTLGPLGGPGAGASDAFLARFADACYPDCDESGSLNVNDYICFQTRFALGESYADCDGSGIRNVNDFVCFQTRFGLGCS